MDAWRSSGTSSQLAESHGSGLIMPPMSWAVSLNDLGLGWRVDHVSPDHGASLSTAVKAANTLPTRGGPAVEDSAAVPRLFDPTEQLGGVGVAYWRSAW